MTLTYLVDLLLRLLGISQTISALTVGVQAAVAGWGRMLAPLVAPITNTYAIVNDIQHGNVAIKAALDSLTGSGSYDLNSILAKIAALPAGSNIIIPTPEQNASGVWSTIDPNSPSGKFYGDEQNEPYQLAVALNDYLAFTVQDALHFHAHAYFGDVNQWANLRDTPLPDWGDILPGETRLQWLTRTEPLFTWDESPTGVIHGLYTPAGDNAPDWWFDLSESEFQRLNGQVTSNQAPIWPGLDGVTLGESVALAGDVTVPGPLHGVIVDITAVPPGTGTYQSEGQISYYRRAWLVFVSDNGDGDEFQWVNWQHGVYTPKRLASAASCVIHSASGVAGSATPWTVGA